MAECGGWLGGALWRVLSDVALWGDALPAARAELFAGQADGAACFIERAAGDFHEIAAAFAALGGVSRNPSESSDAQVAAACANVSEWAEAQGYKETAIQYAEAAARLEPDVSARAFVAGRLCRRAGEVQRGVVWYARAARLARLAGSQIDFANAHLGHGNAFMDLGRYELAEPHFWKALRAAREAGRSSLAGMAHHDLLVLTLNTGRWSEAVLHGERAVALYKTGHPRFPLLAQDIALLWSRLGFFSSALPVYERVLPFVAHQRERILVLGNLARAAAAVHDRIRYERAAREVLILAGEDAEMSAPALYHIAEGARSLAEAKRAEQLAARALDVAIARQDGTVVELARALLIALPDTTSADTDQVPDEGDPVDSTRQIILRKLEKQPHESSRSIVIPPERFPTD